MTDDQWPDMVEMEFGEDDFALPGTSPISLVTIGGSGKHNRPVAYVESAGCAYCNRWAVGFYEGTRVIADGPHDNSVHRRMSIELIYACDEHGERAVDELMETYDVCSNRLDLTLAMKVQSQQ